MPLVGERDERIQDLWMPVSARPVKNTVEPGEERLVTRDLPEVHQRQQKFRLVGFEPLEIVELAHMVPYRELQIPERMQQRLDKPFFGATNPAADQQQQINI